MNGFETLGVALDAWLTGRGGPAAIAARQRARLSEMVRYARERSPFYRTLYQHLPAHVADVRQLPPVTKSQLMARFDEWVTDPAVTRAGVESFVADTSLVGQPYLDRYIIWTSSGSTGEPVILVQDRRSLAVTNALSVVRVVSKRVGLRDLWWTLGHGGRLARICSTGGHYLGVTQAERLRREHPRRAKLTRVFSVLSPLPELAKALNAFQPARLNSYSTVILLLARLQKAGILQIRPIVLSSAGETLTPAMRQEIESAFGARLRETYGCSEAPTIAFDCAHGWLHVNTDWNILEPVDDSYQPVPPGEPSHTVLVTNLANRVQPIIRYDLGDSVTASPDPCSCGSPLPAIRVEGRTDEILTFSRPSGRIVHLLPSAPSTVVEETPGVHRYQIIQTAPSTLTIRLESRPGADDSQVWEEVRNRLREHLASHELADVEVLKSAESPRADPNSGKYRSVWADFELQRKDAVQTS